jgi:hypothetical protein
MERNEERNVIRNEKGKENEKERAHNLYYIYSSFTL